MPKHSVVVDGVKTSVSLEDEFWIWLQEMAKRRNMSVSMLATGIKKSRPAGVDRGGLSSALRLAVLNDALSRYLEAREELERNI